MLSLEYRCFLSGLIFLPLAFHSAAVGCLFLDPLRDLFFVTTFLERTPGPLLRGPIIFDRLFLLIKVFLTVVIVFTYRDLKITVRFKNYGTTTFLSFIY